MMEGRRGVERQVESGLRKGFTPRVIADNCVALEYLARSGVTASHPRNPIYCDVDKMATFSSIGREGEGGGMERANEVTTRHIPCRSSQEARATGELED